MCSLPLLAADLLLLYCMAVGTLVLSFLLCVGQCLSNNYMLPLFAVCSVVSVVGSTNRHTKPIKLGEACDVTNECTLLPGCTVGKGAVLGVFTYGRPDQTFADYSITLGDFTLRNGTSGNDIESGTAFEQLESAATRLIPTWQYVLYHVLYVPFSMTIFTLTTAAVILPPILVPLSVLYNFGWWASILASGLYGPLSFLILLAYLAVMKRLVMPHMAGEYPIFKSFKAAKWQMLALNAHIYEDFAPIMGSVVSAGKDQHC